MNTDLRDDLSAYLVLSIKWCSLAADVNVVGHLQRQTHWSGIRKLGLQISIMWDIQNTFRPDHSIKRRKVKEI